MRAPFALLAFLILSFFSTTASTFAGFKGTIDFTEEEKGKHLQHLEAMMESSAECLEADIRRHKKFIRKYGISAFYGDNSDFAKKTGADGKAVATTKDEKRQMLRDADIDEDFLHDLIPDGECKGGLDECPYMMQPTSCIGLALRCLKTGLLATGQNETWSKLRAYTIANNSTGDAVQDGLQKLGWKILYWNPDTSMNREWDLEEQQEYPGNPKNIWGQHVATWASVMNKQRYYFNAIDDSTSLVDFGRRLPRFMKEVPFFLGIAHLGYHVFPGTYGDIVEAHSTRKVTDKETIEKSEFAPLKSRGGPRGGPYKTGIVAIPPGYLEQ